MAVVDAWRDARSSARIEAAQRRIVQRYWREQLQEPTTWRHRLRTLPKIASALLAGPLLVPLLIWLDPAPHGTSSVWNLLAVVLVFVSGGQMFQFRALRFTAADVLRHRSKAGLLLLRLCDGAPSLLWTGACWAAAYVAPLGEALPQQPLAVAALLLAIFAAPLSLTIGRLLHRLVDAETSVLGPSTVAALAALVAAIGPWRPLPAVLDWTLSAIVVALGVFALGRGAFEWSRRPRVAAAVLAAELPQAPRVAVALGLLLPAAALRDPEVLAVLGPLALVFVVSAASCALPPLLRAVRLAEEDTAGSWVRRADDEHPRERAAAPRRSQPSRSHHRGRRSLLRAQLFLHGAEWRRRPAAGAPLLALRELPLLLWAALLHCWGAGLAALAVVRSAERPDDALAILAAATAPTFVSVRPNFRLHLLGVDYAQQVRHNVRALWWMAAVPTLLAAAAAGSLTGWTEARALVVATLAAMFALRAAARLADPMRLRSHDVVLAVVFVFVASSWLRVSWWWTALPALAVGVATALVGFRRLDEERLAESVRREDEAMSRAPIRHAP